MEVDRTPSVFVAILTYGEYSGLERTLKSVLRQDFPVAEVVVSDDGSGQEFPKEVIERYQEEFHSGKMLPIAARLHT